jgi:hypothetical protein
VAGPSTAQLLRGKLKSTELRILKEAAGELVKVNWKLPLGRTVGLRSVGGEAIKLALLEANKVSEA